MNGAAGLLQRLRDLAEAEGLAGLGVADLTAPEAQRQVVRQGGEWLARFPRGVSLMARLQDALVDELPERRGEPGVARAYEFHVYQSINGQLDRAALSVARALQEAGYDAVPLPASLTLDRVRLTGHLSHKLVAHRAGLGWIGRSCLLITPQAGPRVRLATVLTTAPLVPTLPTASSDRVRGCGRCRACADACPAAAFTGRAFDEAEPREARMAAAACGAYLQACDGDERRGRVRGLRRRLPPRALSPGQGATAGAGRPAGVVGR